MNCQICDVRFGVKTDSQSAVSTNTDRRSEQSGNVFCLLLSCTNDNTSWFVSDTLNRKLCTFSFQMNSLSRFSIVHPDFQNGRQLVDHSGLVGVFTCGYRRADRWSLAHKDSRKMSIWQKSRRRQKLKRNQKRSSEQKCRSGLVGIIK